MIMYGKNVHYTYENLSYNFHSSFECTHILNIKGVKFKWKGSLLQAS